MCTNIDEMIQSENGTDDLGGFRRWVKSLTLDELLELIENLPKELESKYWFLFLGRGEKKEHIKTLTSHHKNIKAVNERYFIVIIIMIAHRQHLFYQ